LVLVTPSRSAGAVSAILDLAQHSTSSIAFISPFNRKADRVLYLRAGADDFITEPFNAHELRARVDALIRRSGRRLNVRDSAIGADESAVKGFESRVNEKLGERLDPNRVRRGYSLHKPGDATEGLMARALKA